MADLNTYSLNDRKYMSYGTIADGTTAVYVIGAVNSGTINKGTIAVGTINTGTIDLVKAGTVTRLEGGSLVVTTGTIASVGGTVTTQGAFATGLGTIAMTVAGSAGTIANTFSGISRGITIVTPALEGTGTATVYLLDSLGGTMISQAQDEGGTAYYGTIVPMTTSMNWIAMANGTQSVAATVNIAVHYEK